MMFKRRKYERPADQDQSKLGTTWADVEGMISKRAFPKWAGRVLVGLVIVVFVLIGFGIWNVHRTTEIIQQQKQASIANCMDGNVRAAGVVKALDELVVLLEGPNPTPQVKAEAVKYDQYVAMVNAPKDCVQIYNVTSGK